MNNDFYNKTIICPVCSHKFETTKIRAKALRVASRDSDFCIYYEGANPMLYDVIVCENCGHAAQNDKFQDVNDRDKAVIINNIKTRWKKHSFSGERNIDSALETFKLTLYNLQIRNSKSSEFAKVCLRIAWLYRLKKDKKENEFLNYALKSYIAAYENETFPIEKLDEFTCMYMIGELSRRLGNYQDSIVWFNKLISNQEARKKPTIISSAREQYHLAKEQLSNEKKENV